MHLYLQAARPCRKSLVAGIFWRRICDLLGVVCDDLTKKSLYIKSLISGRVDVEMATFVPKDSDFVIWGPAVGSGALALNTVYSLYFLPDRFKLIMPPAIPEEKHDYEKIEAFIAQNDLTKRVMFSRKHYALSRQLVVTGDPDDDRPGYIYGSTPEALASAILRVARKQPMLIKD